MMEKAKDLIDQHERAQNQPKRQVQEQKDDGGMDFDEGPRAPPKRDRSQNAPDTTSFMEGQSMDAGSVISGSMLSGAGNDNYLNDFSRNQA